MKTLQLFLAGMLVCLSLQTGQANPIVPIFFNEIKIDAAGWVIEVRDPWELDDFVLTSLSDTAHFDAGFTTSEYQLITANDLQSALYVNPQGDVLSFCYDDLYIPFEQIRFGNVPGSQVAAPLPGQSLCLKETPDHWIDFYYLDNTPTLGYPNDAPGAWGRGEGTVNNQFGNPVPGVQVAGNFGAVFTNSSGYFMFDHWARLEYLEFSKPNYQTQYLALQIWPEDTVAIDVILDSILVALPPGPGAAISGFELKQNYPNPFNPVTTIEFSVPIRSQVRLTIFNLVGETVSAPVSRELPPGIYRVRWDGSALPGGVYFYRLWVTAQAGGEYPGGIFSETKKLVLVK